jgi:hypothetical protein
MGGKCTEALRTAKMAMHGEHITATILSKNQTNHPVCSNSGCRANEITAHPSENLRQTSLGVRLCNDFDLDQKMRVRLFIYWAVGVKWGEIKQTLVACHEVSPGSVSVQLLLVSHHHSPPVLLDLELRLRAPPLFLRMWAGLSILDGGYIPRGTRAVGGPER